MEQQPIGSDIGFGPASAGARPARGADAAVAPEASSAPPDRGTQPPAPPPPPDLQPASDAPTSWATPPTSTPAGPVRRVVLPTVVLLIGLLARAVVSRASTPFDSEAYRFGTMLGSIAAALLVAGIALLILRRVMGGHRVAAYRLAAAAVPAVLASLAMTSVAAPLPDPSTAMVISAPYTLAQPSSDISASFQGLAKGMSYAVRVVKDRDGTTVGLLAAVEGMTHPDASFWAGFDQAAGESSGASVTPIQYHGSDARLFTSGKLTGLAWVTPRGLMVVVYAKDEASARALADAVTGAGAGG